VEAKGLTTSYRGSAGPLAGMTNRRVHGLVAGCGGGAAAAGRAAVRSGSGRGAERAAEFSLLAARHSSSAHVIAGTTRCRRPATTEGPARRPRGSAATAGRRLRSEPSFGR
jgi:hypothetical protein